MENNLNLSESEQLLIHALREANELPINMLLWYAAGLENSNKKIVESFMKDGLDPADHIAGHVHSIGVAGKYQKKMQDLLNS